MRCVLFQALEAHDLTNCVVEFIEEAEVRNMLSSSSVRTKHCMCCKGKNSMCQYQNHVKLQINMVLQYSLQEWALECETLDPKGRSLHGIPISIKEDLPIKVRFHSFHSLGRTHLLRKVCS